MAVSEGKKGRKVGDITFNMSPFLEAIARSNLHFPIVLPNDATDKERAEYAKRRGETKDSPARPEGKKAEAIAKEVSKLEEILRDENHDDYEETINRAIEHFKEGLLESVKVQENTGGARAQLAEVQAKLDAEREERLALEKELDDLKRRLAAKKK